MSEELKPLAGNVSYCTFDDATGEGGCDADWHDHYFYSPYVAQTERLARIATQSVVEDLEGALRRIDGMRDDPQYGVTTRTVIADIARQALASLPSPEPTRCPKCGEIVTPSASPGITHMCDPYQAATYVTESKMGFNAEPTQPVRD